MDQSQAILLTAVIAFFIVLYLISKLMRDWNKESPQKDEDSKTHIVDKYEDPERVPPWTLGDAITFGFGFGMGMFLWGVFLVMVIYFLLTGGMAAISNFFAPSQIQIHNPTGQSNGSYYGL